MRGGAIVQITFGHLYLLSDSYPSIHDLYFYLGQILDCFILCFFRHQRQELEKRQDHKYFANMIRKMKYKFMDHRMVTL